MRVASVQNVNGGLLDAVGGKRGRVRMGRGYWAECRNADMKVPPT